ncbi:MAG TPA: RsmD family RNA methyltransferase [Ignavibacteria bacterium]|nr:RsmD family RNA methyltransferase [Ignavibacteria bacterium]
MRVISGKYKSRILKSPQTENVRPTTDRARETLFNVLNNLIDFEGIKGMDLFCGTGSFGIECLSRGAGFCTFVDFNTKTVEENIKMLKLEENSKIVRGDVLKFTDSELNSALVFADPPYEFEYYDKLIARVLKSETMFVLEHSDKINFKKDFSNRVFLEKKIGISHFTFFR